MLIQRVRPSARKEGHIRYAVRKSDVRILREKLDAIAASSARSAVE
jgi:hypothetical protein